MTKIIILGIFLCLALTAFSEEGCFNENVEIPGVKKIEVLSDLSKLSAKKIPAVTTVVRMNYSCEIHIPDGSSSQYEAEKGDLLLFADRSFTRWEKVNFSYYSKLCMRLERYKTVDNVRLLAYNCSNGKVLLIKNGKISEGEVIEFEAKPYRRFKENARLECTFTDVYM